MSSAEGARSFQMGGDAYDRFMGRYSLPLAEAFADSAGVSRSGGDRDTALDVGCGPGALTGVLAERLGSDAVAACDPSPTFTAACAERHSGVRVEQGHAEAIPFDSGAFDFVLAQLVLHFVSDPPAAVEEFIRVARPGGVVAACVWDFHDGMEMLRCFWDAAVSLDAEAPDEARVLRFGGPGEIAGLFEAGGLASVEEATLEVRVAYEGFESLWAGFLGGVGPAGSYCVSLEAGARRELEKRFFERLGSPRGSFSLRAVARSASGRTAGG